MFAGTITTITGISAALDSAQVTIDWGDGTNGLATLGAVAKRRYRPVDEHFDGSLAPGEDSRDISRRQPAKDPQRDRIALV